eukprot:6182474-Pleurochrysis_carterae.AAC.1
MGKTLGVASASGLWSDLTQDDLDYTPIRVCNKDGECIYLKVSFPQPIRTALWPRVLMLATVPGISTHGRWVKSAVRQTFAPTVSLGFPCSSN